MPDSCVFCRIAQGQSPAQIVYEDDEIVAFHDNAPQAPVHILIIPRRHIPGLDATSEADTALLGRLFAVARDLARQQELRRGYRLVLNTGPDAGQSVHHMHVHLLGGRTLRWPPG